MSRTDKDLPWRLGGQRHPHILANLRGYPKHKRATRRMARAKADAALRKGDIPAPRYPVEFEYYD